MSVEKLVGDAKIVAVVCNQFGDTGKGKICDYLAEWTDVSIRATGGDNAGHTVIYKGKPKVLKNIPTGILREKITILGNGMVINPESLCQELERLEQNGIEFNKESFMISEKAQVILPCHIHRDRERYQSPEKGGIGTTGKGIGPCYGDKVTRIGIPISYLLDKIRLTRQLDKIVKNYPEQDLNKEEIIARLQPFTEKIVPFVEDTVNKLHEYIEGGKKILIEGAQGLALSIEHGTFPYTTSSDCSIDGTASGAGISAKAIDLVLGTIKFPFMTRVGGGPFPTELGGKESEEHCLTPGLEHDIFYEVNEYLKMSLDLEKIRKLQTERNEVELEKEKEKVKKYIKSHREKIIELCNSDNQFEQGVGIRLAAMEYGSVTNRPRRIGWTDAIAGKYAVRINRPLKLILTKVDCLDGVKNFYLCNRYTNGKSNNLEFRTDEKFLSGITPNYKKYEGYDSVGDAKNYEELPKSLLESIKDFEEIVKTEVVAVSNGPKRENILIK